MDDRNEPVEWDYFLTNYERDLLSLSFEETILKYSGISREQMIIDLQDLLKNQVGLK
ncbi:MAG: hypothetical protein WA160_06800 [Pseudobdellovibrio sp.]